MALASSGVIGVGAASGATPTARATSTGPSPVDPSVWVGLDGELYLTEDFTYPCARWETAAETFLSQPFTSGSLPRVRFVVAPNKTTVMPAALGPVPRGTTRCADEARAITKSLQRAHPAALRALSTVALNAARFDQPAYPPGDSHWSPAGAAAMVREVLPWVTSRRPALGGLAILSQLQPMGRVPSPDGLYRRIGASTKHDTAVDVRAVRDVDMWVRQVGTAGGYPVTRSMVTSSRVPVAEGRTLLVHDSFWWTAEMQNRPFYRDLTSVHWDGLLAYLQANRRSFDRIIILRAERLVPRSMVRLADPRTRRLLTAALR